MSVKKKAFFYILILFNALNLFAQKGEQGTITGIIVERTTGSPLEFANVVLMKAADSTMVQGTVTGSDGEFTFEKIVNGEYKVFYSFIGFEKAETTVIKVETKQNKIQLGKLSISEINSSFGEVVVTGQKSVYVNSIDRKTFNVGEDLMSKSGSLSDLLQNVPSIQVDTDGNLSLRGSDNVMVLINGKQSSLMGSNRAAVLQQMPANTIEKIEIITNPSAKYKPDGTSGIINIVLKKNKSLGLNGSISANAGNNERYNGNIIVNYNPGRINLFGSYSLRQDDRLRYTNDYRKRTNSTLDTVTYYYLNSKDHSRPISNIFQAGADFEINDHNKVGISGSYNYRSFTRNVTDANMTLNTDRIEITDYDRLRRDPEYEKDMEVSANIQHTFAKEGHELNLDYTASKSREQEDNHYTNDFRVPNTSTTYDNTLIKQGENEAQFSLEYVNPLTKNSKIESGYILESSGNNMDFFGETLNPQSGIWEKNIEKSNHFVYNGYINVGYGTIEQTLGRFGFLTGVRLEQAYLKSNQITSDTVIRNQYFRIYPSLHLSYKLSDINELQLNYSHRIRRPEGDDLNPFPEYQDPYNLRVGNPKLKPADIHSVEFGYQIKKKNTSFLSTLYYRYTYNSMTDITNFINDSVKVTTRENLSKSNSAGMELVFSTSIGSFVNLNLSTNTYYNTIDASGLGYSKNKSAFAWSANLSTGINLTKSTALQITSGYFAGRLTPQGKQLPSFVMNCGFKQEFLKNRALFIVTVSDVFNTMRNTSIIDTPLLYENIVRKRSARIIYAGLTFTFGSNKKKEKDTMLKYDNQL
jgi:outer membrane receptor protein involved in Fe transport